MAFTNPSDDELRRLLTSATTIAIVGASGNAERPSFAIMQQLQRAGYRVIPVNPKEAEILGERVIVQLQHANSAVVLTTTKLLLFLMNYMENRRLIDYICKKMGPPLGTRRLTAGF